MGCNCGGSKNKTEWTVTFADGQEAFVTESRPLALAKARISGGTVTSKVVPK